MMLINTMMASANAGLSGGCERLLSESPAIILTLATRCYTSVRGKPTEILLEPTKKYFGIQLRNTFGNNIDHDQGLFDTLLASVVG